MSHNVDLGTLDEDVRRGTPRPAYLLHGDDEFLKDERIRVLVEAFSEESTRDFNVDALRCSDCDAARLSVALDALPLMAERRVVVLRDVGQLRKDARVVLDRYLEHPSPTTVVVLHGAAGWKPDAALTSRTATVELAAPTEEDALDWINRRARHLGVEVTPDGARHLLEMTGANCAGIDGELRKLRDFASGPIDPDAVDAVAGAKAGRSATDLIDLVCARDGVAAASLVGEVLAQPKTSAVGLLLSLTTHVLGLGRLLVDREARVSPRQQASNLYSLFGEARSAPVGRPWGEAVRTLTRCADHWDRRSVDRALLLLRDADSSLKETGLSSDEQLLRTVILTICASRRAARAA